MVFPAGLILIALGWLVQLGKHGWPPDGPPRDGPRVGPLLTPLLTMIKNA